ncbi:uncharacterized protein METZ01_LOCUS397100, partial [marine metagenome]
MIPPFALYALFAIAIKYIVGPRLIVDLLWIGHRTHRATKREFLYRPRPIDPAVQYLH